MTLTDLSDDVAADLSASALFALHVLVESDRQHWDGRGADDPFGDAPQQHAFGPAAAGRSNDHGVDTVRLDGDESIEPFTSESLSMILQRSQGNVRQILSTCSRMLDEAADREQDSISTDLVQETI